MCFPSPSTSMSMIELGFTGLPSDACAVGCSSDTVTFSLAVSRFVQANPIATGRPVSLAGVSLNGCRSWCKWGTSREAKNRRKLLKIIGLVGVAQLVRASDCGSESRGFESHHPPIKANWHKELRRQGSWVNLWVNCWVIWDERREGRSLLQGRVCSLHPSFPEPLRSSNLSPSTAATV